MVNIDRTDAILEDINQRLKRMENGEFVPHSMIDGVVRTQLTGSIVENIVYDEVDYDDVKDYNYGYLSIGKDGFFNQQSNAHKAINISKYNKLLFYFKNNSDGEIVFDHGSGGGFNFSFLSVEEVSQKETSARNIGNYGIRVRPNDAVPVGATILLDYDDIPEFKNKGYLTLVVCLGDIQNVSEGSFSCALSGVKYS